MRYNNDRPRDDVERSQKRPQRFGKCICQRGKAARGMAFLHLPLYLEHPLFSRHPSPETSPVSLIPIRSPSSTRRAPRSIVPSHSNQPVSSHFLAIPFPPAITINQNRSQYLILVEWCSGRRERGAERTSERTKGAHERREIEREREREGTRKRVVTTGV